ncbi:SGNH hydrolase-type esterase domain-containing protein [Armillaria mellea]|nr:SGNH hydrolase-type esterase domain-containing protein [Armillaria mellea]
MSFLLLLLSLPLLTLAARFKNLVTFGDSYTDIINVGDGGTAWPVYAAGYADLTLLPFARSGATCSNLITPRPFPSIFESQLPLVDAGETLYTQWIGTNDVGVYSLVTGSNGASIVDVVGCMVDWVRVLYKDGARNFLVQNMVPLNEVILYAADSYPNRYFSDARNTTEWSVFMRELVLAWECAVPGHAAGARCQRCRVLISASLTRTGCSRTCTTTRRRTCNGTAPLNVTGAAVSCVFTEGGGSSVCTTAQGTDRDSFLWYDELHPSEQADRVVAREIAQVARGEQNRWTTWIV